jgi:hypothetical protein
MARSVTRVADDSADDSFMMRDAWRVAAARRRRRRAQRGPTMPPTMMALSMTRATRAPRDDAIDDARHHC